MSLLTGFLSHCAVTVHIHEPFFHVSHHSLTVSLTGSACIRILCNVFDLRDGIIKLSHAKQLKAIVLCQDPKVIWIFVVLLISRLNSQHVSAVRQGLVSVRMNVLLGHCEIITFLHILMINSLNLYLSILQKISFMLYSGYFRCNLLPKVTVLIFIVVQTFSGCSRVSFHRHPGCR